MRKVCQRHNDIAIIKNLNKTMQSPCFAIYWGLSPGLDPASERRLYFVMASLIGWTQAHRQRWYDTNSGANLIYTYPVILHIQKET